MIDETGSVARDEAPPAALWAIAALALAPFPLAAMTYGFGPNDLAQPSLTVILTWSAVVLSFLGGVRWGMETGLRRPRLYRQAISFASGLVAWVLLLSHERVPDSWVVAGAIAAFLLQWLFDHQAPDVPARYPKLSTAVAAAACVSLAVCLDRALRGG